MVHDIAVHGEGSQSRFQRMVSKAKGVLLQSTPSMQQHIPIGETKTIEFRLFKRRGDTTNARTFVIEADAIMMGAASHTAREDPSSTHSMSSSGSSAKFFVSAESNFSQSAPDVLGHHLRSDSSGDSSPRTVVYDDVI
mmetsp:Transcript_11660/g.18333  ORF Transcript_11660/g.18333 Transcript_11660/m.18333 type:complete len:138 (+) Transcript_11660:3-416(+)